MGLKKCSVTHLLFPLSLSKAMFRMALQRVFVYGTLKRGQPNYHLLVDPENGVAKFLGEAKLTKRYPLVVGSSFGVPLLLPVENQGKVRGTMYPENLPEVSGRITTNLLYGASNSLPMTRVHKNGWLE